MRKQSLLTITIFYPSGQSRSKTKLQSQVLMVSTTAAFCTSTDFVFIGGGRSLSGGGPTLISFEIDCFYCL